MPWKGSTDGLEVDVPQLCAPDPGLWVVAAPHPPWTAVGGGAWSLQLDTEGASSSPKPLSSVSWLPHAELLTPWQASNCTVPANSSPVPLSGCAVRHCDWDRPPRHPGPENRLVFKRGQKSPFQEDSLKSKIMGYRCCTRASVGSECAQGSGDINTE